MHLQKFREFTDIGHMTEHYSREKEAGHYSNPDIDQDRLDEDRTNYAPTRYKKDKDGNVVKDENNNPVPLKQTEYIKQKIAEVMGEKRLRKDAVRMCTWVVQVPRTLPPSKYEIFFAESYRFLVDRYSKKAGIPGEDICISCYRHRSETTQHLHFAFLPVLKRGDKQSFCAKDLINRRELHDCQVELAKYLESKNICRVTDLLNGRTIRDSNGRAYSVKQLKMRRMERSISYERGRF